MTVETLYETTCDNLLLRATNLALAPASSAITVTSGGDVTISIAVPNPSLDLRVGTVPVIEQATGDSNDGFRIAARTMWIETTSSKITDDQSDVANLTFTPAELCLTKSNQSALDWTRKDYWLKGPWPLGRERWSWGGYDFDLVALDTKGQRRASLASAKLTVHRRGGSPDVQVLKDCVVALLSLAFRTRCWLFMEWTYIGEEIHEIRAVPYRIGRIATHLLVPWHCLSVFMSTCMDAYITHRETYGLKTLVEYFCRAYEDPGVEMKFIAASVFMEAFKFYWAQNVSMLQQDKKANGLIRGFFRPGTKQPLSFSDLLNLASQHLALNHDYTFLDDRNALFHTGRTASNQTAPGTPIWPAFKSDLAKLHDQIDDVILTLLRYQGEIRSYWNQSTTVNFPR